MSIIKILTTSQEMSSTTLSPFLVYVHWVLHVSTPLLCMLNVGLGLAPM